VRIDAERLIDLVNVIHAGAACDQARARSAQALSDAFGGAAVMLFRQADALVEDLEHAEWPEESVALCSGRFNDPQQNRLLRTIPNLPMNVPLRPDLADDGAFERSDVFVNAMLPYDLVHPLGALLARTERDVSIVSLMGRSRAGPFGGEDEQLLMRLMPALASADRVRRLLVEAMESRRMLSDALDRIPRPVAVVDEGMRLRYANSHAQTVLEDGSLLKVGSGRIAASEARADERLRASVRGAVSGAAPDLVPLGPGTIRVEPLRPGEAGVEQPLALVTGSARLPISAEDLRALYRLTPREAEVAALFAAGMGIAEAAARLDRSPNTIKSEARSIYAKLGVQGHAAAAARIRDDLGA
jgi:DNA-binding CsgD family transcriptional regulator